MPRQPSKYESVINSIPEFIQTLKEAKTETEIAKACQSMKDAIDKASGKTVGRRDPKTMSVIRGAVTESFPPRPVDSETNADFPYYLTDNKVGKVARLEHLAHKYLIDDRNLKEEQPSDELEQQLAKAESEQKTVTIKSRVNEVSLESFGLSSDEIEAVNQAIGESDIKEWVKQAIMQRANAINNKAAVMNEDLSEVPSEVLMSDKKYRTNPTAARELTSRAVRVVKQWNHDHPDQKWCITNKLIGELTGVTVKAIAKAVEGMDLESYNKSLDLTPVVNRLVRSAVGEPSYVMNIASVTGIEGSESNSKQAANEPSRPKKTKNFPAKSTSRIDILDYLKANSDCAVCLTGESRQVTYVRLNDEKGFFSGMKCLESGEEIFV